jgi:hypothetical protein
MKDNLTTRSTIVALVALCGCANPTPSQPTTGRRDAAITLSNLMRNEINPAFSKISFLIENGHALDEDAKAQRAELKQAAAALQVAMVKLRSWQTPPIETAEGRQVFYTYAGSLDVSTQKLIEVIGKGDIRGATPHLDQISDTCNNCHHFFHMGVEVH